MRKCIQEIQGCLAEKNLITIKRTRKLYVFSWNHSLHSVILMTPFCHPTSIRQHNKWVYTFEKEEIRHWLLLLFLLGLFCLGEKKIVIKQNDIHTYMVPMYTLQVQCEWYIYSRDMECCITLGVQKTIFKNRKIG